MACRQECPGATEGLGHVVAVSGVGLSAAPGIYEWSEGRLSPVSVLPSGAPAGRGRRARADDQHDPGRRGGVRHLRSSGQDHPDRSSPKLCLLLAVVAISGVW